MLIILGAGGHVGSAAARALLDQAQPVTAVVHAPAEAAAWAARGARAAVVDLYDADALRAVLKTGRRAFLLNPPADVATDQDYKTLQTIKDMTGKLGGVNLSSITFRLDIPHMVPNPKYKPPKGNTNAQYQQMQNIYRQQAQIMATTNPIQLQDYLRELLAS